MTRTDHIPVSTLRVCIDEVRGEEAGGRVFCKLFAEPIRFGNQGELLLRADEMFDRVGYPQAFQQKRSFKKEEPCAGNRRPELYLTDRELTEQRGRITTVHIIVESRRRTGWQGIYTGSSGESARFISEMDLLRHMETQLLVCGIKKENC